MATFLIKHGAICMHLPKTAHHFFQSVLDENKIPYRLVHAKNSVHQKLAHHSCFTDPDAYKFIYKFIFVRKPDNLYESWWNFTHTPSTQPKPGKYPWEPMQCIPRTEDYDDFNEWVSVCLLKSPAFVTRMYEWYIGPRGLPWVDYVGRYEHLYDHLSEIFSMISIDIPAESMRKMKRINESKPTIKAVWDESLRAKINAMEINCIERFYGENEHNLIPD